ncbi:c-type cytochrome [Thalassovita sp.]|uniref:c-type cytochrome n=1 Tax=Thalassovita sp. TaxID=1979401 RepID=UPI0039B6EEC7
MKARLVFALAFAGGPTMAEGFLPYDNPAAVETGKGLYAEHCASCHGAQLEGQANWRDRDENGYLPAPPHDQSGHTWHHADAQLFMLTKYGVEALIGGGYKSHMTPYEDVLTDEEIIAVLAYIKSTWPERVIELHNGVNKNSDQ